MMKIIFTISLIPITVEIWPEGILFSYKFRGW